MAGSRIKNITGNQTTFNKDHVLLVDRIDTGSGDWLQARKIKLGLLGNSYIQGSSNGINWHDEILVTDTYIRYSTDGGTTWINLNTDIVREGSNNLYFTEARVLSTTGVQNAVDLAHTHSNKTLLDNLIDSGDGSSFLSNDGTYITPTIDESNVFLNREVGLDIATLQELHSQVTLPHIRTGGVITDLGTGSISITEATAYLKTSNSDGATNKAVTVPATTLVIPLDENIIIYIDYNAGSPIFTSRVSTPGYFYSNWDELPFATAVNLGSSIIIRNFKGVSVNPTYKNILGQINYEPIRGLGGLEPTDKTTRQFSIDEGAVLLGNEYTYIPSIDTSIADTFTKVYYNGTSWVRTPGQSTVDNAQYNNTTTGLVPLNTDEFTIKWLYYVNDTPSFWVVLDGQESFEGYSSACLKREPDLLPPELNKFYAGSALVAKFIVQQGRTEFVQVESSFSENYCTLTGTIAKSYSFTSQGVGAGNYYLGGFYDYANNDANLTQAVTTQTFGAANRSHAAHPFVVAGGAGTVDTGVVGLRVTGTRVEDNGTRTPAYSETIISDITTPVLNEYYEASKFIGTITYELYVVSGTPTTYNFDFNYGLVKYEDFGNSDFDIDGFEVVGLAGANDSDFDIKLIHHNSENWVYATTGFTITPTVVTSLQILHGVEHELINGEYFSVKLDPVNYASIINGNDSEGLVIEVITTANNSVQAMDAHIGIRKPL